MAAAARSVWFYPVVLGVPVGLTASALHAVKMEQYERAKTERWRAIKYDEHERAAHARAEVESIEHQMRFCPFASHVKKEK